MRITAALPAIAFACLWSCSSNPDPVAPRQSAGPILSASSWGPETPPFNNEISLRDVTGNGGVGHVKFRQPNDADRIVYLDTWVRDLKPNTEYRLQRATDVNVNDDCTGTNWLTLGMGTVPQSITTDSRGTGRAALFRNLAAFPVGSTFDIHFRVIDAGGAVVLESSCYQFVVTQ